MEVEIHQKRAVNTMLPLVVAMRGKQLNEATAIAALILEGHPVDGDDYLYSLDVLFRFAEHVRRVDRMSYNRVKRRRAP